MLFGTLLSRTFASKTPEWVYIVMSTQYAVHSISIGYRCYAVHFEKWEQVPREREPLLSCWEYQSELKIANEMPVSWCEDYHTGKKIGESIHLIKEIRVVLFTTC